MRRYGNNPNMSEIIRVGEMATDYELRLNELRAQKKQLDDMFKEKIASLTNEQTKWLGIYLQGARVVYQNNQGEFVDAQTDTVFLDLQTLQQAEEKRQLVLNFDALTWAT